MKMVIVIPNYNHGDTMEKLLNNLQSYQLPCVVVNDGSNEKTKRLLEKLAQQYHFVTLLSHEKNQGKGAAIITAVNYCLAQQYTHLLQIDADGQHDVADIEKFIATSHSQPNALITGLPIYDESVPKSRLYGRKITNFWVIIETWSRQIKDAMCGFRVYPLAALAEILQHNLSERMDFDIEIMVRLYWYGLDVVSIPTRIIYPQEGHSNFKLWRDNVQISLMHTRLFFIMLTKIPKLLSRNFKRHRHWSQMPESGSLWAMKLLFASYKFFGRKIIYLLLYPIVGYYFLFHRKARNYSRQYLQNLQCITPELPPQSSFKHLLSFAQSVVDKFAVWNNELSIDTVTFNNKESLLKLIENKQGGVIFTAHLGNIEIARRLAEYFPDIKINAVVFTEHAKKINSLLQKINQDYSVHLIEVSQMDAALAIALQQKIEQGEFVVIVADRTSPTQPQRMLIANFLQKPACFPQGSFILAGLLQCPCYFMLCLKNEDQQYEIHFQEFSSKLDVHRSNRQQNLNQYAQQYADLLTDYCKQYPLQWFNFFDFWQASTVENNNNE